MIVCIDGPAASGKSTIAKLIAQNLDMIYIDTGAMYRAVALSAKINNIHYDDSTRLEKLLYDFHIEFKVVNNDSRIFLNGEDISEAIRTPDISKLSSTVATIKFVRQKMVESQRLMGKNNNVVLDGRDIGTVVFPQAQHKFFLTASLDVRAIRREKELHEKGQTSDFEQVKKDLIWRDQNDTNRVESPLKKAIDAIEIDTTDMTIDQVVNDILRMIKKGIE